MGGIIMKEWIVAEIEELNITETEHERYGNAPDGGYAGDGGVGTNMFVDEQS